MEDVTDVLDANRSALDALITVAERCETQWTTPRAPGKWSPSQLTEHIARTFEESAHVAVGAPSKFPTLPRVVRPLVRRFLFDRVLKNGTFPKARTNKAMDPESGPATVSDARARLNQAFEKFDQACREAATRGAAVESATFGRITIRDYARFVELHTRHHTLQLPEA